MKRCFTILLFFSFSELCLSQCDSLYTYYSELPSNVTVLVGDSCLYDNDIAVLDSMIDINDLDYNSPLEMGTQTWFNGRLRFLVAGYYGNSSGVNDTIYTLPDNIGNLTALAILYMEWNRISELPESFSNLTSLISVYLNNNIITTLGDSIGNLININLLDLGYNELEEIPESICNIENVSYLWLFNNNLETLPECFCNMNLEWDSNDNFGYPYFAIGANALCDSVASCVAESENFELSLDQFYYSFPVYSPQDCDSVTTNISEKLLPFQYTVSDPYPNPFNPLVAVDLNIPYDRKMDIRIYDATGREIDIISSNDIYSKGKHTLNWNAENHPSGLYFIKIVDGFETKMKKIMLLK